ncbi:hypothetical protein HHI36_017679 [Cryptolaemus montrouzieri]|uniref:Cytochrome P450 n=1 Tax=Cryptolaemus montrouzieri TaxID=559131 RepID=A0ABD2NNI0_9CUCU
MSLGPTIALVVLSVIFLTIWLRKKFSFWKSMGLKTPPPSFFFDNMKTAFLLKNSFADRDKNIYRHLKDRNLKHGGTYFLFLPVYVPTDLEIIKSILQTDHQNFSDRGFYVNEKGDPMSAHLFSLGGPKWKILRKKLTPTFTSGKIKMMFDTLMECTVDLKRVMDDNMESSVNIKDILARFTTDIIGSCAFGLNCNSLEDKNSEFRDKAQDIFHRDFQENIKQVLLYAFPELMKFLNVKMIHRDVSEFFRDVVKHTVDYREKNDVYRKDFMHLLIQLKNNGKLLDDEKLIANNIIDQSTITMDELAAQAFIFFIAGFETSSSAMSFCLYELATNKDIQDKVREEILQTLKAHGNKLNYDAVGEMKYLDKVLSETLRKYPPLSSLYRSCTKDYQIPGTDIVLRKGMRVMIPTYGIHHDPEYYPDPDKFDPERFSDENREKIPDFAYLPFGIGPRICIGMRFGILQTKVGLITLLSNYQFSVSGKTTVPLKFDPESLTISTKGDLWLDYKKYHPSSRVL